MEEEFHLSLIKFQKNAYITMMEDKRVADRFFIIREGKVRLTKEVQVEANEQSDILGPGDFFGVISTMSGHSHIETAKTLTDVTLLLIHREQFGQLIQNNSPVAIKILIQFSKRMRYLNEALAILTLKKKTSTTNVESLFMVAGYYVREKQYNLAHYAYRQYIRYCPNGEHVCAAKEHLKRISPYIKADKLNYKTNDFVRVYPKDTMIFSQCEPGEEIFIIKSGLVKITEVAEHGEMPLAILKAGDIFGEMALLESKPRGASAIAYEECQLIVINRKNFEQMIKTQPQLIARLTTLLAERIWLVYKQLANTRINDSLGRLYHMLLILLEKQQINLNAKRSYMFNFGAKDLINMVGLSQSDGSMALKKLLQNKSVEIVKGKMFVKDVLDFFKQATCYIKKLEREKFYICSL